MRILLALLTLATLRAADLRLGIVGTDTSHATAFTKLLNDPAAPGHLPGARVVAAFPGGSPDIANSRERIGKFTAELREQRGVRIVDRIGALCGEVDAILILSVDGRAHLEQFREAARCGRPVYINKPLAATLADARAIATAAAAAKVPWFTSSALRFTAIQKLRHADVTGAFVWGPGPFEEHHALDLSWYGIHPVEMLYSILGPGVVEVTRTYTPEADVVTGRWSDGRTATARIVRPYSNYGAVVFRPKNVTESIDNLEVGYVGLVEAILEFARTGRPPVDNAETLELFAFLDAALESRNRGGVPVAVRRPE